MAMLHFILMLFVLYGALWLFFMFGPARCFNFYGYCLALWSPYWGEQSWLLYVSLVCGMYIVCHCLLFLFASLVGYALWMWLFNLMPPSDFTLYRTWQSKKRRLPFTLYPANTQRRNNVVSTSLRRHDVAATSKQRYYDVLRLLGMA